MKRREFLELAGAVAGLLPGRAIAVSEPRQPSFAKLPRWRGFNLLEKFAKRQNVNPPFRELDFAVLSDWGFDFVRLPLSYRCWADGDPASWLKIRDGEIRDIDEAIAFGEKYRVHININFHRAPGYCVSPPAEPLDLWTSVHAMDACAFHWAYFARRYKGIPNYRLTFNPINEPPRIAAETHARVIRHLVASIRAEDPHRLIIVDGLLWGTAPASGLEGLSVAQSTRGYEPMRISHWKAGWIRDSEKWPAPTWPLRDGAEIWDRSRLVQERIAPWKVLEKQGFGVHVGEWGVFNKTPHDVVLSWMRDYLDVWKSADWGWALWNLRGVFGVLDSEREDVRYEDFRGMKLDRRMLELLMQY